MNRRTANSLRALTFLGVMGLLPACSSDHDDDTVVAVIPGPAGAGALQFSAATYSADEGGGSATLTVERSGGTAGVASVWYQTEAGTATGLDFQETASTQLVWADGDSAPKTILIPIKEDGAVEGAESFFVHLGSNSGAALGTTTVARVDIADDEAAPAGAFQFSSALYTGAEKTHVTVSVIRSLGTAGAATVDVAANPGTAGATDFSAVSGSFPTTLAWLDGESGPKTFNIALTEDGAIEGDEFFTLVLQNPSPGTFVGSPGEARVEISDADTAGTLRFQASVYGATESSGSRTITVRRNTGSQGAVSVTISLAGGSATQGTDFTFAPATLSWADGESGDKTFVVTLMPDDVAEGSETVTFELSAPTGGAILGAPSAATLTILE
jgi:hypothetical protein